MEKQIPQKQDDQILMEEFYGEFPGLQDYKFIDTRREIDSSRRIIELEDSQHEEVIIRFLPGGSRESRRNNIRQALIAALPSIVGELG